MGILQLKREDELDVLHAKTISLGTVTDVITDIRRRYVSSSSHTGLGIDAEESY
jgi:hypothetical protein